MKDEGVLSLLPTTGAQTIFGGFKILNFAIFLFFFLFILLLLLLFFFFCGCRGFVNYFYGYANLSSVVLGMSFSTGIFFWVSV